MPERLSASEVRDLLHAKLDSLLQECDTVAENALDNAYLGTHRTRPR